VPEETPADRLREGAAYIRGHFCRHDVVDVDGNVCTLGAITRAWQIESGDRRRPSTWMGVLLANDPIADLAVSAFHSYMSANVSSFMRVSRVISIEDWNDSRAKDGREVAEHMEKAAAAWEENGSA